MWIFNAIQETWTETWVKGDTPAPRHGHSACLIEHLMYIFGGESFEGVALDDLYVFNTLSLQFFHYILTVAHRWFALSGRVSGSPSPRWGHTMSAFGKNILLLGGNPDEAEDGSVFVLDTSRLDFPPECNPAPRNDSIRSVASEPPIQPVQFSSDARHYGTWSGGPVSQPQSPAMPSATEVQSLNRSFSYSYESPLTLASTSPIQSPTHSFSVSPQSNASQYAPFFPQANPALESRFQLDHSVLHQPLLRPTIHPCQPSPTNPIQCEPTVPQLSIHTHVIQSQTPRDLSPELSPGTLLAPPPDANHHNYSEVTAWLIETSDEEQYPPSLSYTPPGHVPDSNLLEFLKNECVGIAERFKVKALTEKAPDRESHFSIGTVKDCTYERFIDSGTNSEVFQVNHSSDFSHK